MMTDETPSTDPKQQIPDLSGLADFQFGPAWARPGAARGATTAKDASPGGNVALTAKAVREGLTGKTARAAPSATAAIRRPAPPWRNRRKVCAWSCAP